MTTEDCLRNLADALTPGCCCLICSVIWVGLVANGNIKEMLKAFRRLLGEAGAWVTDSTAEIGAISGMSVGSVVCLMIQGW